MDKCPLPPLEHFCHHQILCTLDEIIYRAAIGTSVKYIVLLCLDNLFCLHQELLNRRRQQAATYLASGINKVSLISAGLFNVYNDDSDPFKQLSFMKLRDISRKICVSSEESEDFDAAKEVPKISQFKSWKMIGRGGFGSVYKASIGASTEHNCVVKIICRSKYSKTSHQPQLMNMLSATCDHPCLISCYATFPTSNTFIILMQIVNGVDLLEISTIKMSFVVVQLMAAQLYSAIAHVHAYGFIHRDVKTSNAMVDYSGRIYLIDFDTAVLGLGNFKRSFSFQSYYARTAMEFWPTRNGTFPYMAPEVISFKPSGRSCDWWSYGVTVFRMAANVLPFLGHTRDEVANNIVTKPPPWKKLAETKLCLVSFLQQILVKRPQRRLGSTNYLDIHNHDFFADVPWDSLLKDRSWLRTKCNEFLEQLETEMANKRSPPHLKRLSKRNSCFPKPLRQAVRMISSKLCQSVPVPDQYGEGMLDLSPEHLAKECVFISTKFRRMMQLKTVPTEIYVPNGFPASIANQGIESSTLLRNLGSNSLPPKHSIDLPAQPITMSISRDKFSCPFTLPISVVQRTTQANTILTFVSKISKKCSSWIQPNDLILGISGVKLLGTESVKTIHSMLRNCASFDEILISSRNTFRLLQEEGLGSFVTECPKISVKFSSTKFSLSRYGLSVCHVQGYSTRSCIICDIPGSDVSTVSTVLTSERNCFSKQIVAQPFFGDPIVSINGESISTLSPQAIDESLDNFKVLVEILPLSVLRTNDLFELTSSLSVSSTASKRKR